MCRGKKHCTELDVDQSHWNKRAPLTIPDWFEGQIDIFIEAVDLFIEGDRAGCIEKILTIRDDEMTHWYIEHGQMSGMHRKRILNIKNGALIHESLRDPIRTPAKYQNEVFRRDGFRCRYCGCKLISQNFFRVFIKKLNASVFERGSTNLTTHGIIHAAWPVADHVVPWIIGGKTDLGNLVSSCATCNYGKAGYTIEQIGIENPLEFSPILDGWDGLESKVESAKKVEFA